MTTYSLYRVLRETLKNGSPDLVTRPSGLTVRERIEHDLQNEKSGSVVALDFSGIGIIDYSCADEIVAKLISRLLGNEYGEKYIILTGLNTSQKENIEVALERKGLAVVAYMRDGSHILLGTLHNYLRQTWDVITEKNKITARDLAEILHLEANTSGTRALNLHKKKLVRRTEETRNGVRVWIYERL